MVRVFGRQPGQLVSVTSAYDAAVFLLQEWPNETGHKHRLAREIMLKCLEGGCSAAVARVAFVEAAKEAGIFMESQLGRAIPAKTRNKRKSLNR
ncbi:DUF982 domain-containing protein [Phyllobacterium sp. UNC302MFCol5.2]|uniref:DUF982 domain-containing protein n=1 Tax=Phyllobacterium sp. UNC302MFCol5.2 TaxID=1449065 RepID=UPI0018CC698C|nr:DUF982 domain-containing protein [Phyllobacterium sp. UNC302MFCol5.2]